MLVTKNNNKQVVAESVCDAFSSFTSVFAQVCKLIIMSAGGGGLSSMNTSSSK